MDGIENTTVTSDDIIFCKECPVDSEFDFNDGFETVTVVAEKTVTEHSVTAAQTVLQLDNNDGVTNIDGAFIEDSDCNGLLCAVCGLFQMECNCHFNEGMDSDHNYVEYYHSVFDVRNTTITTHKRTGKPLTRKRKRYKSDWKKELRKNNRQSGNVYVSTSGKVIEAKSVIESIADHTTCRFMCATHISHHDQHDIHIQHWRLSDDMKRQFYIRTTELHRKVRCRNIDKKDTRKKKMSYLYYLDRNGKRIRVCKDFYLNTLSVDARRIRSAHASKDKLTGEPSPYRRGKHSTGVSRVTLKQGIREHIESIPKIDSHYCRRDTNKSYITGDLNLQILYEKYVELCTERGLQPAKLCMYRSVFNSEYNIEFQKLKKDRCDICEAARFLHKSSNDQDDKFSHHIMSKNETHNERNRDREQCERIVICFDLQNVISLPKASVSNFFYKRKLNVYHLTAHSSDSKQSYGAIWPETLSGRTGNDIASGLIMILEQILIDNPNMKHIILWSDSCVPQNRNKVMSTALLLFLKSHPEIETIEQKFCEPGHSEIQEIDNIHSQLEKILRPAEIYSPLGLIRVFKRSPRNKPIKLMQLRQEHMKNYMSEATKYKFDVIPYSKVKTLKYNVNLLMTVDYKTRFSDDSWNQGKLLNSRPSRNVKSRRIGNIATKALQEPKTMKSADPLCSEKIKDLRSMFEYMPEIDRMYMQTLLPEED